MQENFEALENLFEVLKQDYLKATNGNKSAAKRVRGTSSKIQKLLKEFRKDVLSLYKKED